MRVRYVGSGPYCYANSLAMMLGPAAPEPGVIEVLTGSPFGVALLGGSMPFFNPLGWDPRAGLDLAIELLGWTCVRTSGGPDAAAAALLRQASPDHPVLAGPLEFGLLRHHPGAGTAIGSDHYVVVIEAGHDFVRFHDPHGHPYATLPNADFLAAWRAESIGYATGPFTAWTAFRREREVDPEAALRRLVPVAAQWLAGVGPGPVPPGSLGGAAALDRLAALVDAGLEPGRQDHLAYFAVRVGTRRLADAATALESIGRNQAAGIADQQARILGAVQHPLVTGDRATVARLLRQLAPRYAELRASLSVC
ncbi:MAG TPA: hypothetical protein VH089_16995 [Streptosporangiaceae bacterium]|nr:hypothetical protein [Streptosporangiaceae bacterium]